MTTDLLPAALLARLPEATQKTLQESTRDQRMTLLAAGLAVNDTAALAVLAENTGLPVLEAPLVDRASLAIFPARLAHEFQVVPVLAPGVAKKDPSETPETPAPTTPLLLATSWPADSSIVDWMNTFTPRPLVWHLAPADRVQQLINDNYGVGSGSLDEADLDDLAPVNTSTELEADADAAVVRFVTDVITQAINESATDIHFEPQEGELRIRYRVDGLLVAVPLPENLLRFQDAIISRLKIMARLNISEKRLPQDGRIDFRVGGAALDIRVSTFPTIYAESISLRLLNQRKQAYTMDGIGLTADEQALIVKILDYPHGLILVTGPTGSGKSTSLNAFLRRINSPELRLVTIEDPIEYEVPGANQMQTRSEIGLTFASALRSVLRQDPDVIMVGEIRDLETAEIAIRASLTGHLVFSTLHTNDAPGALTRLTDMGVEPFLVASSVELVIAQRLVRRLCVACSKTEPIDATRLRAALDVLHLPQSEANSVHELHVAVGCRACRQTGYRGRIGLFEILQPKPLHDLIVARESAKALGTLARSQGMRTLQQSGWDRVKSGATSLDELLRTISTGEE
ncbi:GspE/PulE family protein [Oleiharenicola lentus]|uniref:GspE/PulE family protein n=1 Tax=Oleiharenicola lentus TaxID=2508720 RepID=UPI003F67F056